MHKQRNAARCRSARAINSSFWYTGVSKKILGATSGATILPPYFAEDYIKRSLLLIPLVFYSPSISFTGIFSYIIDVGLDPPGDKCF